MLDGKTHLLVKPALNHTLPVILMNQKKFIMRKLYFLLLFSIQAIFAQAPGFNWAGGCDGAGGNDFGLAITTDAQGNIYSTGAFKWQVDFDPGPGSNSPISAGVNDLYVQKLSPTGNLLWVYHIGSTGEEIGRGIAIDADGNVLITGNFTSSTVDFEAGVGVSNLTCNGNSDVFILKLTSAGSFVWARSIGGSDEDMGYSICSDANSNVFVGGHFTNTVDFDPSPGVYNMTSANANIDAFMLKLDASGFLYYAKQFASDLTNSYTYGIKCNSLGQVGIVGAFSGDIDLDPNAGVDSIYSGNLSGFFSLLDNNGNFLQGHANNGAPYYAMQFDLNNHLVVTGYANGYVDLDPGPAVVFTTPNLNSDAFVARFRPNGNFVWGKSIAANGYENGFGIEVDGVGNVISVGNFSGTIDFDPGPGTVSAVGNGNYDIFIHKLDTAGNYVWHKQIGSTGDDQPKGVSVDPFGNISVTGYYNGTVDFNPGAGITNLTSAGGGDIYTVRFQCLSTTSNISITGCDHYISPSGRYTWNTNGIYADTITNVGGCDSVMNITLTIHPSSNSSIAENVCRSYTSPSGNYVWTSSGSYTDTLANYVGCDSIITINLTVTNIDTNVTISNGIFTVGQAGGTYQWFDCIAAAIIPGEINQSFTPSINGSYGVLVNYNGCTDTTSCFNIFDVGLDENSATSLNIHPNPSTDFINIKSSKNIENIIVMDATGKVVLSKLNINNNICQLNLKDLASGIYLIQTQVGNQIVTRKIIKE